MTGFLTPLLVDRWSRGAPDRAGTAYAVNVLGCILGPLVAGFWLLPAFGERGASVVLALPLFLVGVVTTFRSGPVAVPARRAATAMIGVVGVAGVAIAGQTRGFETLYPRSEVRRDHTATVIATGTGRHRQLLVNGMGMTLLTPITKMIAHLPMAALDRPPKNALVIALGMGTTFRSLLTWPIEVTAVELVPSVPPLLGFFHHDAEVFVGSPRARIVVDDGRRFMELSGEQFDVITVDPPPPVSAAGSSLLYSKEFYTVAKKRLRPGGILQQWLPGGDKTIWAAVTLALVESFPHVRVFHSMEGWGAHFLASDRPIEIPSAAGLVARMPESAIADLVEWNQGYTAQQLFGSVLSRETRATELAGVAPWAEALSDDRPQNEYFLLRRYVFNPR